MLDLNQMTFSDSQVMRLAILNWSYPMVKEMIRADQGIEVKKPTLLRTPLVCPRSGARYKDFLAKW